MNIITDCRKLNQHINKLRGTKSIHVNGWTLDVDGGSVKKDHESECLGLAGRIPLILMAVKMQKNESYSTFYAESQFVLPFSEKTC